MGDTVEGKGNMTAGEVSCPRFRIGVIFSRYPPVLFTIRLRFRRCCVLLRLNLLQGLPVLIHIGRVEQNDLPDHFGSLVIFSAFYEHFTDHIKLLYGLIDLLNVGQFQIFFGYRLADNTLFFNGEQPILVTSYQ